MTSAESADAASRERKTTWLLLLVVGASFLVFCTAFVPRLTNVHFGDMEFSGWSGPMGSRLLDGDVPYLDFILPIPPGSFAVLALIEKMGGRPLLLQELWLNAGIHALLGALAYAIASPLTTRVNAVLVTASTLVALTYLNKECAYDHTAQLFAWGSIAVGLRALVAPRSKRRDRLWVAAGVLGALTLAFKQSTGIGAVGGWIAALAYLALSEHLAGDRGEARRLGGDGARLLVGVAVGVALGLGLLVALGSQAPLYFRAVFTDGSALKGGSFRLIANLWAYLTSYGAFPSSLGVVLLVVVIGARIVTGEGLHLGREPSRRVSVERSAWWIGGAVALTFGTATLLLRSKVAPLETEWVTRLDWLKQVPTFGFVFGVAFFLAHLRPTGQAEPDADSTDPDRVGRSFNALFIAALACSIFHNTSAPEFRPFYDNNVVIPVAFLFVMIALDRARARLLKPLVFAVILLSLFGNKFQRALGSKIPIGGQGHWAGMYVSPRGKEVVRAALRVRALAEPDESVLVLPEDVQLTALINRPRPPLRGAIVFVDQYPKRVLDGDLARLERELPKVIVIHPQQPHQWVRFYRIWAANSPAEQMLRHVLMQVLPRHYVRDSSYETQFHGEDGRLDVWVKKP